MVTVCVSSEALALLLTKEELRDVRAAVRLSLENAGRGMCARRCA